MIRRMIPFFLMVLLLACGMIYKPQIPLTVNIPDSLGANTVNAIFHPTPTYRDTCLSDSAWIAKAKADLDSLKLVVQQKAAADRRRDTIRSVAWIGLHIATMGILLIK